VAIAVGWSLRQYTETISGGLRCMRNLYLPYRVTAGYI
jgi:hypothetical protein